MDLYFRFVFIALSSSAFVTVLGAQDGLAEPREFHDRVAGFLAHESPLRLPSGDTLLTWHDGHPVLFHTVRRDADHVEAGMLRADRMAGVADVRWANGHPSTFRVVWVTPQAASRDSFELRATVQGARLMFSGSHDTSMTLPSGSWAVADYGMEELLLPVLDALPIGEERKIAVLRPFGFKWDTLNVKVQATDSFRVASYTERDGEAWHLAFQYGKSLLWLRRSKTSTDEKRPLVLSPLGQQFDQLRTALESATRFP